MGPLGKSQEIDKFGTVVIAMGCYGIGAVLPVARAMKQAGNRVIAIMEARAKELVYWDDKYREFADRFFVTTFGDSGPDGGRVSDVIDRLIGEGEKIDRVVAMGCMFMMMKTAEITRPHELKTIVSLNPVMIDGTGMCGVCRCTVGGKTRFACVDGPDFDAHEVDWQELTYPPPLLPGRRGARALRVGVPDLLSRARPRVNSGGACGIGSFPFRFSLMIHPAPEAVGSWHSEQ